MKKLVILLIMSLAVVGFAAAQLSRNGTMYVNVKELQLKSSAGVFSTNKGTLKYGDQVTVLQTSGNYAEIRSVVNASLSGWVPSASLNPKQVLPEGAATVSDRDKAMASKGMDEKVEKEYRTQNKNLEDAYADVDKMEAITVNENELKKFLEDGRLAMGV